MFVIKESKSYKICVEKSTFISYAFLVNKVEDIKDIIDNIKKENIGAKHILYAYKIGNILKTYDDKEPGKISSNFINLINMNNLDNILIIVVRYFGGILLGASRLSRTYSSCVAKLLNCVKKTEINDVYIYTLETDYKTYNEIKKARYRIENVVYFDKIKLEIISKIDIKDSLKIFKAKIISIKKERRAFNE